MLESVLGYLARQRFRSSYNLSSADTNTTLGRRCRNRITPRIIPLPLYPTLQLRPGQGLGVDIWTRALEEKQV